MEQITITIFLLRNKSRDENHNYSPNCDEKRTGAAVNFQYGIFFIWNAKYRSMKMNNIYVRFVSAQPHSLQLSAGKNDLISPSQLCSLFCPTQAEVNSIVPRQKDVNVVFYCLHRSKVWSVKRHINCLGWKHQNCKASMVASL